MNTAEMITSFGLQYASEINTSVPGWEQSEILAFLNRAQRDLIKELAEARQYERLTEVIGKYEAIPGINAWNYMDLGGTISNAVAFPKADVTNGMLYYINSSTQVTRTNPTVDASYLQNILISEALAFKFAQDGTNQPWFKQPRIFMSAAGTRPLVVVLYDIYTSVHGISLEYVMYPTDISLIQSSRLHTSLHDSIVNRAVTLAIESLANPRIQTQPLVNK